VRVTKLWLDGYGRFSNVDLELVQGLQIIAGPNERGKSTVRAFVCDMLYGQKRSSLKRQYDDSNELRMPWGGRDIYGGRLEYTLDSGTVFEVQRRFDRKNESVNIFDRTHGSDVTADFRMLKNRESDFAHTHLGISKEVFANAAVITHMTLEALGDAEALGAIRNRILSLTDSGGEKDSCESALARLDVRNVRIGKVASRTKPLPAARSMLADLIQEHEFAIELRRDLAGIRERRRQAIAQGDALREKRTALEAELELIDRAELAERLDEIEELQLKVEDVTRSCFSRKAGSDFPLESLDEILRTHSKLDAATAQFNRTRSEYDSLSDEMVSERERLGTDAQNAFAEIPEESELRLAEVESQSMRLTERIHEVMTSQSVAEERMLAAQSDLSNLPDFSQESADPVEWLTQLASSFRIAQRARDEEQHKLEELQNDISDRNAQLEEPTRLFENVEDFTKDVRDYELNTRIAAEQLADLEKRVQTQADAAQAHRDKVPGYVWLTIIALVFLGLSIGVAFKTGVFGVLLASAFIALIAVITGMHIAYNHISAKRASAESEDSQHEMAAIKSADSHQRVTLEELMSSAGCENPRELEALHEKFIEACAELDAVQQLHDRQVETAEFAQHRAQQVFDRLQQTFLRVGEKLDEESEVRAAASRAISRYQQYRDAKRRLSESRDLFQKHSKVRTEQQQELDLLLEEDRSLSLQLRQMMRENGYPEESKHDSAVTALKGYRIRSAQVRQRRGRLEFMAEKLAVMEGQLERESKELDSCASMLSQWFEKVGAHDLDSLNALAEHAREYRAMRAELDALERQLNTLLRGQTLEDLRDAAEELGTSPTSGCRSQEEVQTELQYVADEIECASKEEHALHIHITQRSAGSRPLSEIEEEREELQRKVKELEFELQSSTHAMAVIEEVSQERHSRIAPLLAHHASEFFKSITSGAYDEMHIDRDMQISVRIPQTNLLDSDPGQCLSKGTVDQIYLALRLAVMQVLSENSESIPMLLDDPFANYDDLRLAKAMQLLAHLSKDSQMILFTCRDDVKEAAEATGVHIIEI